MPEQSFRKVYEVACGSKEREIDGVRPATGTAEKRSHASYGSKRRIFSTAESTVNPEAHAHHNSEKPVMSYFLIIEYHHRGTLSRTLRWSSSTR